MRPAPKGTIVQPFAGANGRNMAFGSSVISMTGALNFQSIRLNNNDRLGNWIAVWDVTVDMDPTAAWAKNTVSVSLAYGPSSGPPGSSPAFPISPLFSTQPGLVQAFPSDPGSDTYPYQVLSHAGLWRWQHDWPLFYIPPHYYFGILFVAGLTTSTGAACASFYWETGVKGV